jgi:hypothetical protein
VVTRDEAAWNVSARSLLCVITRCLFNLALFWQPLQYQPSSTQVYIEELLKVIVLRLASIQLLDRSLIGSVQAGRFFGSFEQLLAAVQAARHGSRSEFALQPSR